VGLFVEYPISRVSRISMHLSWSSDYGRAIAGQMLRSTSPANGFWCARTSAVQQTDRIWNDLFATAFASVATLEGEGNLRVVKPTEYNSLKRNRGQIDDGWRPAEGSVCDP